MFKLVLLSVGSALLAWDCYGLATFAYGAAAAGYATAAFELVLEALCRRKGDPDDWCSWYADESHDV